MPKKKAAAKKKVSKKSATSRSRKRPIAKSSKKSSRKKVGRKKVSKKKVSKKKASKKASKKKASKKKAPKKKAVKKKSARKKSGKKTTRAGKSAKKRKEAKRKVTRKKSASKSKASKKSAKKTASTRSRSSKKKTTASRAARPGKAATRKAPAKRKSASRPAPTARRGNVLMGPVPGFEPYQPKRNEEYMNEDQLEHFRGILQAWKRELMEEVDRTMHHMKDDASNPPDPNDRATQETEFGLELRTRDRERKLLKKIESAIDRIDEGSYGYCEETGDEIGLRRLEARPVATLCVEAQERRELAEKQFRDREDYYR